MLCQFGIMAALMIVARVLGAEDFIVWGAAAYVVLSVSLTRIVPIDQRLGMRLIRQEKFAEAIPFFERSHLFFIRHSWLDRWRYVALLTASRSSYRETALLNAAFCYSQIGEGQRARETYNQTLREFPDSQIAKAALRLMDSVSGVA